MPHINFAPINTKFRNSTGCKMSVDYLSKENEGKELSSQEHFFNDKQDFIGKESAKKTIDSPSKEGMSPKDARYFEVSIPVFINQPIEWVNRRKLRAKDSVNTVWWF